MEKRDFEITKEMVNVTHEKKTIHTEDFTPAVIEPSFGIGRIMYSIFEHSFQIRSGDDEQRRTYLTLPPLIAPYKCSVLPLSGKDEFKPYVEKLCMKSK